MTFFNAGGNRASLTVFHGCAKRAPTALMCGGRQEGMCRDSEIGLVDAPAPGVECGPSETDRLKHAASDRTTHRR